MYSCHKNSYLQGNFKDINPGLLNRAVQKAWGEINCDENDLEPPLNRLTSEQPSIPVQNVDITRRPQGFGRWALPKLKRELHDKDHRIQIAALTSICDIVHDPEKAYEAINLKFVDRLTDLTTHEIPEIRERAAICLTILAHLTQGKEAIVENNTLLANLADCVDDDCVNVKLQVAACLEMVARFWCTADVLCNVGFVYILLGNLDHEEKNLQVLELWIETLIHLTYGPKGKKIALEENVFKIILKLLQTEEGSIAAKACELLANICTTKEGRNMAKETNLLQELSKLLQDEEKLVHTAAAQALMFCTITSSEKIKASKIKSLPKRLVQLTRNRLNSDTQMFAFRCLTNICEHPTVRQEVREKYLNDLKDAPIGKNSILEIYKNNLISRLN